MSLLLKVWSRYLLEELPAPERILKMQIIGLLCRTAGNEVQESCPAVDLSACQNKVWEALLYVFLTNTLSLSWKFFLYSPPSLTSLFLVLLLPEIYKSSLNKWCQNLEVSCVFPILNWRLIPYGRSSLTTVLKCFTTHWVWLQYGRCLLVIALDWNSHKEWTPQHLNLCLFCLHSPHFDTTSDGTVLLWYPLL